MPTRRPTGIHDLGIVGGGLVGAWLAYWTVRCLPEWSIVLLEQSEVGAGAAHYAANLDFPQNPTLAHLRLSQLSRSLLSVARRDMPGLPIVPLQGVAIGSEAAMRQMNLMSLGSPAVRSPTIAGAPLRLGAGERILTEIPAFRATSNSVAQFLVQSAEQRAITLHVHERVAVTGISSTQDRHIVSCAGGQQYSCKHVVTATGPWATAQPWTLAKQHGIRVKQIVAFRLNLPASALDPTVYLLNEGAFFMPEPEHNRWTLSITSHKWDCKPDPHTLRASIDDFEAAKLVLARYLPQRSTSLGDPLVFCDAYSPQRHAVILSNSADCSLVFAGACSGSGFRLAAGIAWDALSTVCPHVALPRETLA